METKNITIVDVAHRAGVSKGTVDRVLHQRGEVSQRSIAKVNKAIKELGYEPNLYASLLATKKARKLALLLPVHGGGDYWDRIETGFLEGCRDHTSMNVEPLVFSYDQYDIQSFRKTCEDLLEAAPEGVILPPFFKNDTLKFVEVLKDRSIPYVYVDTKLDSGYLACFGMPMARSGALCAALLTERCAPEEVGRVAIVRITRDKNHESDPTAERRSGFMDYMSAHFPSAVIDNVFISPSEPEKIESQLDAYFLVHTDVRFVVMFNSRIHLIASYLKAHPVEGRRVIGFDDLDSNRKALRDSAVSILIAQHTQAQSLGAVQVLTDYLILHKLPQMKDNYMHMDILTSFNEEDY